MQKITQQLAVIGECRLMPRSASTRAIISLILSALSSTASLSLLFRKSQMHKAVTTAEALRGKIPHLSLVFGFRWASTPLKKRSELFLCLKCTKQPSASDLASIGYHYIGTDRRARGGSFRLTRGQTKMLEQKQEEHKPRRRSRRSRYKDPVSNYTRVIADTQRQEQPKGKEQNQSTLRQILRRSSTRQLRASLRYSKPQEQQEVQIFRSKREVVVPEIESEALLVKRLRLRLLLQDCEGDSLEMSFQDGSTVTLHGRASVSQDKHVLLFIGG